MARAPASPKLGRPPGSTLAEARKIDPQFATTVVAMCVALPAFGITMGFIAIDRWLP